MATSSHTGISSIALALAVMMLPAPAAARDRSDVILLRNGDRVTGEILSLQYGELNLKTRYMSTVLIQWVDVLAIESTQQFIVEDLQGRSLFGVVTAAPGANKLTLTNESSDQIELDIGQITKISPGEATFWSRLEGSLSVGFDYSKSSDITTINGSYNTTYRAPHVVWSLSADLNSTRDPLQGTLDRDTLSFNYQWLRSNRRFITGLSSLERNEETGVEARFQLGAGVGRYFLQTNRSELAALVGVGLTQEWSTGTENSQQSLEGILGANWRIFKFNTPKISLNASAVLYPSITESGRYRTLGNVSLRREIISDFYLDVSLYQSYDSQPPDSTAEKSDYGITTSLGYSFY